MNEALKSLSRQVTPRVAFGLAVLVAIGLWFLWSRATTAIETLEVSVESVDQQIRQLRALEGVEGLDELRADIDSDLAVWESRLLAEETQGLNVVAMQTTLVGALNNCGLSRIEVQVETLQHEETEDYLIYEASVRANDPETRFPLCLQEIAASSLSLRITELIWTRTGTLIATFEGYGAAEE